MKIEKPKNDEFYPDIDSDEDIIPEDLFDDSITTVCFTGHRKIPENVTPVLRELLSEILDSLYDRGARIFKAGGAVGFDTMAAQAVIDLKIRREDRNVKLHLCLAAPDQAKNFSRFDSIIFRMVKENADSVSYESEKANTSSYFARNRALVNGSDVCVAYCTKQSGGTYYTCTRALTSGVEFINLADFIEFE